ncbi:MAG TPA: 30S ribosomal protein S6 [Acholeplasma sp.]|jgi:small subunit ribosomal protein S6|nr:30S ribosomal protein S6 [Acholeplasmatales bacterium]HHV33743.1 30S ribosomal protein S6 [Acholeplasma sp.]
MKKYEIMYIVKPDVESERLNNVIERLSKTITDFDSTILEHKEMGLKELAYEIQHYRKGYYIWQSVEATNEAVAEFNRIARITEDVIRFIVLKDER